MAEKKEKELSFEESLQSLEEIVKKLEVGDVPLDDAIEEFNKAMKQVSELLYGSQDYAVVAVK